jgi:predicted glycosyltransferase
LSRDPGIRIVLLSGSTMATQLAAPLGVSVVRLPTAVKVGPEQYRSADPSRTLRVVRAERAKLISSALLDLRPDVFLVDHAPLGMKGELVPALAVARERLPATRVVLGLRDILDDPVAVRRVWEEQGVYEALQTFYDRIFVYGSQQLFDVAAEYEFPAAVRERTRFTGYVAKREGLEVATANMGGWAAAAPGTKRVLVMGGGGGDARRLFELVARAWPGVRDSQAAQALLVTGPLMDAAVRRALLRSCGAQAGISVVDFSPSMLSLVAAADIVVSMGGYNSVTEVVAAGKPLVCCPRTAPRTEQLMRASILERLGLARVVRLDADHPELATAISEALVEGGVARRTVGAIDLDGGRRVADEFLGSVVESPVQA